MFKTAVTGLDAQTARLNSGPLKPEEMEDTRDAVTVYLEWEARQKAALGVADFREDIADTNPKLIAGLASIAASGAPAPIKVTTIIAYPANPLLSFKSDVYRFVHFQNPRLGYDATEYLVAVSPQVVINDLLAAGIRKAQ